MSSWWEAVALTAAVVGALALLQFWIAAHRAGEANPTFTVSIHAMGIVGVDVLMLVPALERRVDTHVMSGR
jgi:hypothetical protein